MDEAALTRLIRAASTHQLDEAALVRIMASAAATNNAAITKLTTFMEEDAQKKLEPWRVPYAAHLAMEDQIIAESKAEARRLFIDRAKTAMLSPDDVIFGSYVECDDILSPMIGMGIVLRLSGLARIRAHNWHVAKHSNDAFLRLHGPCIEALQWPLFPPLPELSHLNLKLLEEAAEIAGGSPGRQIRPSVYKRAAASDPHGGEYFVPVVEVA